MNEKGKEMSDPRVLANDTQCLIDRMFDEVIYWSGVIDIPRTLRSSHSNVLTPCIPSG